MKILGLLLRKTEYERNGKSTENFDLEEMTCLDGEVFLDGGCYDGESAHRFIQWVMSQGKEPALIYLCEPDKKI